MDAADIISQRGMSEPKKSGKKKDIAKVKDGKVLVFMTSKTGSWKTPSGVVFTADDPFQLCDVYEARALLENAPFRFVEGTEEEVKKFYGV